MRNKPPQSPIANMVQLFKFTLMQASIVPNRACSARPLLLVVLGLLTTLPVRAESVSGSYTGNGSSQTITVGFQPDVVIIKDEIASGGAASAGMQIRTSTMSFTKHFGQAASGSTATDRITAFTSTGFTVGASTLVNSSTIKYNYLAIKAVAGEIAVGNYSGDGVDNRNLTGVGFQPDLVLTMSSTGATSTWRTSEMTADESMFWDLTPAADLIQGLLADGFQVGTDARVNGSGGTYHYIACKNVTGKFKVGSYTGTGGGQSFTGLGFAPEGLFIKRNGSTIGNLRFASTGASASADVTLQPNSSWYATNAILSLDADGFTIGTAGNRINGTTAPNTYHWFAFAEATTASASAPTVASPTKASITHNSATLGGNVTADGGAALSERGVVYSMTSINSNPEIGGIGVTKAVASGTTTGVFTAAVSGLVFSTGYTYKAYATNSAGTSCGRKPRVS